MSMPPKKELNNKTVCSLYGIANSRFKRHARQSHLPWYLNPVSSCADCLKSEGDRYTTAWFHLNRGHGGIVTGLVPFDEWSFLFSHAEAWFGLSGRSPGLCRGLRGGGGRCLSILDFPRKK